MATGGLSESLAGTPVRRGRQTWTSATILVVALCVAIISTPTEWRRLIENELHATAAGLLKHKASQQVHIVEIDANSIAEVGRWPWPRQHYARLIEQLDDAGARSIVFDIDFSSHQSLQGDTALAEAIETAEAMVVLPTFSQTATEHSDRRLDALPIPMLRDVSNLASASVLPDADARVREMPYGTVTDGIPRPSLSAQISGVSGSAHSRFPIDFSIDPASIPRHSFISVERGEFDRSEVAGRDILIGATAIELGDRYGVPVYGVIPGVTIQALAAETLIGGGLATLGPVPVLLLALLLGFLLIRSRTYSQVLVRAGLYLAVILGLKLFAYFTAATLADIVPGAIALIIAATAQAIRIAKWQLDEKALFDEETGFPNASAFGMREPAEGTLTVVAFVKEFDTIQAVIGNDGVGQFVKRLVDRIRSVHHIDAIYRTDARMVAWSHEADFHSLNEAFAEMAAALNRSLEVGSLRIDAEVAFGVASGNNLPAASRAASLAAKEGKLWHAHEEAESVIMEQRVSLMGELDEAIADRQLQVVYQPKLRLATERIESVEALIRWDHPVRGHLRPDSFIPLAEETNRIDRLTLFVLEQTISDLSDWSRRGIVISAAINISANLITTESFVSAAISIVEDSGVPRDHLIFEVTESATMKDPDLAVRNLARFRELGVLISMDDYGTGQSTLSYLQKLPLSELKIDRAFVQNVHTDRSDAIMVRSTIQLAHSLGLRVVCEGIEDEACLDFLRQEGCDYAQGYFISRPLSASDLEAKLQPSDSLLMAS
ncbi:MAG: EAL domain-containing protein [Erythrobacter sp.]